MNRAFGQASGSRPIVLVVDDDRATVRMTCAVLDRAGFEAVGCNGGAEALRAAGPGIAAAVVDIHMPDANGLELSIQLRAKMGQAVPIIILSGDNSMQTIRSLFDAGATYFLSKPVNTSVLIEQLRHRIGFDVNSSI